MRLLTTALLLVALNATAGERYLDVSELSDRDKAELILQVQKRVDEQKQAEVKKSVIPDPDVVQQYVSLGENIGKAFGGAAKEIGIAVNEFVTTPVGIMTMTLIVWNYMGNMILHMISGLLLLIISIGFIRWWVKKSSTDTVEYDTEKTNIFGDNRIKNVKFYMSQEVSGWSMALYVMFVIASIIVMFTGW